MKQYTKSEIEFISIIEEFLLDIEQQEKPSSEQIFETNFKLLLNWSSMKSLLLVLLIETHYGVMPSSDEMFEMQSFLSLYKFIQNA